MYCGVVNVQPHFNFSDEIILNLESHLLVVSPVFTYTKVTLIEVSEVSALYAEQATCAQWLCNFPTTVNAPATHTLLLNPVTQQS